MHWKINLRWENIVPSWKRCDCMSKWKRGGPQKDVKSKTFRNHWSTGMQPTQHLACFELKAFH